MMNFVCILFSLLLICVVIHADDVILTKSDHDIIDQDDYYWYLKTSIPLSRPSFPAFIRFYNTHTAKSEYEIDCSRSSQILYYSPPPQIIFLTTGHLWTIGDTYYITLDKGVLFSNDTANSTAYTDPKFWRFTVIQPYYPGQILVD